MSDIDIWNAFHVRTIRPDAENNKSLWERMPIMRKEVKLGFAVGGVVLAIVLVWVLSLSGSKSKPIVASAASGKTAGATSITPSDDSLNNEQPRLNDSVAAVPQQPSAAPTTAPASDSATAHARKSSGNLDWDKLLNGTQQIPLIAQTPSPTTPHSAAAAQSKARVPDQSNPAPAADANTEIAAPSADSGNPSAAAPAGESQENAAAAQPAVQTSIADSTAQPAAQTSPAAAPADVASSGPRSHQVQPGETLSSIATAAYGNPRFYTMILRANPKLNPRRMKPGTIIVLPDISQAKTRDNSAGAGVRSPDPAVRAQTSIGSAREYKIQPGDSLYRISMKLYGKSAMQEKIYELNRTQIGPDKARLRVGMVLKLPAAPTATAAQ